MTILSPKELIQLGKEIIASNAITEEHMQLALQFSYGVDAYLRSLKTSTPTSQELEELTNIHQLVLARLKSQREVVGKSLKGLKQKGKGIKAYLDQKKGRVETQKKGKKS